MSIEVPLFHIRVVMCLICSALCVVELRWNYGWNFM